AVVSRADIHALSRRFHLADPACTSADLCATLATFGRSAAALGGDWAGLAALGFRIHQPESGALYKANPVSVHLAQHTRSAVNRPQRFDRLALRVNRRIAAAWPGLYHLSQRHSTHQAAPS